jgi:uncharacterized membrane protein YfcA
LDSTTAQVLAVIFFATIIRSTFGFGEALIAVPLLALTISVEVAAPLAVLLSVTVAAFVVVQDWRKIHLRSATWMLIPTFVGIPLGILLLTNVREQIVKAILGALIMAFSGYFLLARKQPQLHRENRSLLLACGFLAGVLGGAYGMNGPPLVLYGAMRRWSPQHFRATLQGYFLPASLVSLAGYWLAGVWVPTVTHYYMVSLVVAIPAIVIGRMLNHRLRHAAFIHYLHAGLVCVGLVLLIQAIWKSIT